LGLNELAERRVPLDPRTLFSRELSVGSMEKIRFSSELGADVLAYLALPRAAAPPYPLMICLQGHSSGMHNSLGLRSDDEATEVEVEGGRDFARQALREGWAALCIEQRSLGQRAEQLQARTNRYNPCHDAALHALLLGRTLLGERLYDVERGIDYASTRPEIDLSRVGITGNSGGGTVAIWAAALLGRIGFAMPSCALCTFRDSLMSIYHCADNYVPGVLKVAEMADVAGLIAPRPMVVVTGEQDEIFPIEGVRRCHEAVRRVYTALGHDDRLVLAVGRGGHRYYPELAWPAARALLGNGQPGWRVPS